MKKILGIAVMALMVIPAMAAGKTPAKTRMTVDDYTIIRKFQMLEKTYKSYTPVTKANFPMGTFKIDKGYAVKGDTLKETAPCKLTFAKAKIDAGIGITEEVPTLVYTENNYTSKAIVGEDGASGMFFTFNGMSISFARDTASSKIIVRYVGKGYVEYALLSPEESSK
ncbi:MAG: hypothetical protein WCS77_08770 [Elusimicrobiaceae bacterium]